MEKIPVQKTGHSRLPGVDMTHLEFGKYISDHMFLCQYSRYEWHRPEIVPYQDLVISPTTLALHYGQSVFEGMKAFRTVDGHISIFRIEKHYERFNRSLERMCMPEVPFDLFSLALVELVRLDRNWVPAIEGSALYLRPFVFASESRLGVKVSEEYKFIIVTGPVPTLYPKPIKVKVEKKYIRAAKGGTGYAKCAGNYGGAFYPTQKAREEGFDQVIWTDARDHEYFEESGTMNLMFVINGRLVTPPVSDSILDGVTRDSLLQLAAEMNIPFEERPVSCREVIQAFQNGNITEAFGAGTAAVVAPIDTMGIDGVMYPLPSPGKDAIMFRLRKALEDVRSGVVADTRNWNTLV